MRRRARQVGLALALGVGIIASAAARGEANDGDDVAVAIADAAAGVPAHPAPADATPVGLIESVDALAQQAEDHGAIVVLLGLPSKEQRAKLCEDGAALLGVTSDATRRIDEALSKPGPQTDETQRVALARESILPLRAARACLWLAACSDGARERERWAERARLIAQETHALTTWAVCERSVVIGLADLALGEAEAGIESLGEARDTLRENEALKQSTSLEIETLLGIALATARARSPDAAHTILDRIAASPPFTTPDGSRRWNLAMLSADVAHRIGAEAAAEEDRSPGERVVERSVVRYGALVDARDTTQPDGAARRRDVEERVRRLIEATGIDPTRLPAIAGASVAAGVDASDAQGRASAVAMLERAIETAPLDHDPFGPDLLFQLGRLSAASGEDADSAKAAQALLRFAELAPADPRAPSALAAACAAALRGAGAPEDDALALRALRAAVASPAPVPHADTWRLQLARVLSAQMRGEPLESRWPAMLEASAALGAVQSERDRVSAAGVLAAMWLEALERIPAERPGAQWAERLAAGARDEADSASGLVEAVRTPEADRARAGASILRAQALLILGEAGDALEALPAQGELASDVALGGRGARTRFLALVSLGRSDEAFEALSALAAIDMPVAIATLASVEERAFDAIDTATEGFPTGEADPAATIPADILARCAAWRRANKAPLPNETRLHAAQALLLAGRAGDVPALISTTNEPAPSADELLILGEAQLALSEDAAAFDAFRRVGVALEPGHTDERTYWHAWARMFEILQRRNHDGARSSDIRREIARLRTLDSWGAFPDCTARIEAVGRAVGP